MKIDFFSKKKIQCCNNRQMLHKKSKMNLKEEGIRRKNKKLSFINVLLIIRIKIDLLQCFNKKTNVLRVPMENILVLQMYFFTK